MKLALITPVDQLQRYATQSDGVHLVLADIVLKSPEYADFYRSRSEAGDTLILDNGAYEYREPMSIRDLIEAGNAVRATTIVAPDFPGRPWRKTYDSYRRFRDILPKDFSVFACPQSEDGDAEGWQACFESFVHDRARLSHIGMSILACPTAFHRITNTNSVELNRFAASAAIRRAGWGSHLKRCGVRIHYLGLGEWNLLPLVSSYDDIGDSLDTKRPLKIHLSPEEPVDLLARRELADEVHAAIQLDIDRLQFHVAGRSTDASLR